MTELLDELRRQGKNLPPLSPPKDTAGNRPDLPRYDGQPTRNARTAHP